MADIEFITHFLKREVGQLLGTEVNIDVSVDDVVVESDDTPIVIVDGFIEGQSTYGSRVVFNDVTAFISVFTTSKEVGWNMVNGVIDELHNYGFRLKTKGQKYIDKQGRNMTQIELKNEQFNGKAYKKRLF